uniref:Ig-like domain-containing protein n=1 Tax=Neolamprologus brichardi TaxID=32507 RepID=A0A3Q4H7A3_NEOBR
MAITPAKAIPATVRTTPSTLLKIASSEVTATNPSTTVPFTGSQEASSGKLSHKESTASRHDHEAATKPSSPPASLLQTKHSHLPLLKSTLNQHGTDTMLVNLVVLSQPPRVLHPRHREMTVHLGDKVSVECKVEGHPAPRVTWVLPNHVHVAAGSLSARYTDRGIYQCIGSSAAGTDSVSVRLHVRALPPVIQQSHHETATITEGSPAYIHCTATGSPPSVIRWFTPDGAQLTASLDTGQNRIVFPNGTLYIQRVGKRDTGRYECSASNTVASSRRTVILNIRKNLSSAKASITSSSPQRTDVIYGSSLLLNCVATGQMCNALIYFSKLL